MFVILPSSSAARTIPSSRNRSGVLLCIFVVDLVLFWLQGVGGDNWLRWSVLAIELFSGLALCVFGRISGTNKTD